MGQCVPVAAATTGTPVDALSWRGVGAARTIASVRDASACAAAPVAGLGGFRVPRHVRPLREIAGAARHRAVPQPARRLFRSACAAMAERAVPHGLDAT